VLVPVGLWVLIFVRPRLAREEAAHAVGGEQTAPAADEEAAADDGAGASAG
jgi:hypothetical protein